MENSEWLDRFQDYLIKKDLSKNTIASYSVSVRLFFRLFSELTPENAGLYRSWLVKHYSPATVNQRIYAINHFVRFVSESSEEIMESRKDFC